MHKRPVRYVVTAALASLVAVWVVGPADPAHAGPAAPSEPSASTAAGKAGSRGAPARTGRDAEILAKQELMRPLAQRLINESRAADSDISGVSLDVAANTINVYRTDRGKQLRVDANVPSGVTVTVHPARFSRTTMDSAVTRVRRDAKALGERNVSVQSVGHNVDGSGITVTVLVKDAKSTAERDKAEAVLQARYGNVVAKVNAVERQTSDKDLFFTGWRFNDFSPWYGGDRIASTTGGCTGGFSAVYSGAPVMLTAAHCGGVGTTFWNGPTSTGGWNVIGNMVFSDPATDVGAISVSGMTNSINIGPADGATSQLYIGAWGSPIVGEFLCQSGSYTGEVCDLYVVDTAQYVCTSWVLWWCTAWQGPLADVVNWWGSGSYSAGFGDSGGPVYHYGGVAKGLVHGVLTPTAQANYPAYVSPTLWCPAPEGWSQRCSSGFSFAHMPGY